MDHYLVMNRNKAIRHVARVRLENMVLKADWDDVIVIQVCLKRRQGD